ncbi:MAG TPA: CBS domain-containing protein [Candidatus Xenobia bacterium]|jgi:CBS domain-containing protein
MLKTLPKTAGDLAHWNVVTVSPDTLLSEVARALSRFKISGVPVRERGRIVGIVTLSDLARAIASTPPMDTGDYYCEFWEERPHKDVEVPAAVASRRADQVMTRQVHIVEAREPLAAVIHTMQARHIHRVLVHDEGRIGMLTYTDVAAVVPDLLHELETKTVSG